MSSHLIYEIVVEALRAIFLLGVPVVVVLSIVGGLAGAFQSATSIHEPVIGYALRLLALVVLCYLLYPGYSQTLISLFELALK